MGEGLPVAWLNNMPAKYYWQDRILGFHQEYLKYFFIFKNAYVTASIVSPSEIWKRFGKLKEW